MSTPDTTPAEERERIAPVLGKIASGLYVATAAIGERPVGMLCSFVEQCSFEPPMISIAVGAGRPLLPVLEGHGLFGLHILSKQNGDLLKAFSRPDVADPFEGQPQTENLFGIPQLASAWGFLACKVAGKLASGDHTLFIAEVFDGSLQHPGQEANVRIRSNGFRY